MLDHGIIYAPLGQMPLFPPFAIFCHRGKGFEWYYLVSINDHYDHDFNGGALKGYFARYEPVADTMKNLLTAVNPFAK
jgi:hypothetical protein